MLLTRARAWPIHLSLLGLVALQSTPVWAQIARPQDRLPKLGGDFSALDNLLATTVGVLLVFGVFLVIAGAVVAGVGWWLFPQGGLIFAAKVLGGVMVTVVVVVLSFFLLDQMGWLAGAGVVV